MSEGRKLFQDALSAHKANFDPLYKTFISECRNRYADIEVSPFFFNEIERLHDSGGARLRSFLFCLGFELIKEDANAQALKASIAMELIHSFLLIHDDIIDRSMTRRDGPSAHYSFVEHQFFGGLSPSEKEYFGSRMAILCGDLLCVLAFELLGSKNFETKNSGYLFEFVSMILVKTIFGQGQDIFFQVNKKQILDNQKIVALKTAHYSFELPLCLGMYCAGSKIRDAERSCISEFALSCGIAYQIRDDIQDTKDDTARYTSNFGTKKFEDQLSKKKIAKNRMHIFETKITKSRACLSELSKRRYRKEAFDLLKILPDYIADC